MKVTVQIFFSFLFEFLARPPLFVVVVPYLNEGWSPARQKASCLCKQPVQGTSAEGLTVLAPFAAEVAEDPEKCAPNRLIGFL